MRVVTLDRRPTDGARLTGEIGVPTVRLPMWGHRRYPFAAGVSAACEGVDVVHVFAVDGLLDALLWRRPAPVGVSTAGLFHHGGGGIAQALMLAAWSRHQLRRVNGLWFTSSVDQLRLPGLPGRVLAPGLDLSRQLAASRAPEVGRWLVPGRIDRHKGHVDLFRAVAAMPVRPQIRVAGGGALAEPRAVARALGLDVTWVGEVSDADWADELTRCEVALFPSRFESFGLAVVEAMASGVPCVVHPGGALVERVRDGVDGAVVDFRDSETAAKLLGRPVAASWGNEARRSAQAVDWQVRLADHEAAWAEAAA